jgi:hypothetical protein
VNGWTATILGALGGGAAVALALSRWLGKVWAERILANTEAEHSEKLERLEKDLQLHLDRAKWPMTREDALAASFRDALERFLLPTTSAVHSVCWLTWLADKAPEEITVERLALYEAELHKYLPQIASFLTLLAAHDAPTFEQLKSHAESLYVLDHKTAKAVRQLLAARNAGSQEEPFLVELTRYHVESGDLERAIPEHVAGLVQEAHKRRAAEVNQLAQ